MRANTDTSMPSGMPQGRFCVQWSIDSRIFAIHNDYCTLLHPSSTCEPRHLLLNMCCPLTNVIYNYTNSIDINTMTAVPNRAQRPTEHWHDTSPSANHHNRCMITRMILPQVHLRKPCYEFPFGFKSLATIPITTPRPALTPAKYQSTPQTASPESTGALANNGR